MPSFRVPTRAFRYSQRAAMVSKFVTQLSSSTQDHLLPLLTLGEIGRHSDIGHPSLLPLLTASFAASEEEVTHTRRYHVACEALSKTLASPPCPPRRRANYERPFY